MIIHPKISENIYFSVYAKFFAVIRAAFSKSGAGMVPDGYNPEVMGMNHAGEWGISEYPGYYDHLPRRYEGKYEKYNSVSLTGLRSTHN